MTLEEESILSYYKKITVLDAEHQAEIVQHLETKHLYVKKRRKLYDQKVYELLKEHPHPFYPRILHLIQDGEDLIVLETYIPGKTLQEFVNQGKVFAESETAELMIQICDGIAFLHQQDPPVIHRDIKPSNLILTEDGILKMIDCNSARRYEEGKNRDTVLLGTRGFAAPEQYGFRQTDPRSDIFSMGILANILLTGQIPQKNMASGRVGKIIAKCMEMEPENRYKTVGQLKNEWLKFMPESEVPYENKRGYQEKGWAFPGFRSAEPWKMILASGMYLILFLFCFTVDFYENGTVAAGRTLWANRIASFFILLGTVFLWGNYRNIQKKLPLPQNSRFLKAAALSGYTVGWFFLIIVILTFVLYW